MRRAPMAAAAAVTAAGAAAWWARRRWLIVTVNGASMTPTLAPGDRLLARRAPPAAIRTGDIVVAERPDAPHPSPESGPTWSPAGDDMPGMSGRLLIKRAVAVPGDPVPAARVPALAHLGHHAVPPDMYVVLGDNLSDSFDSRIFGYLPGSRIIGVV